MSYFTTDFTCPSEKVKCQDGLQCIAKYKACTNPFGSECTDGSDADETFCSGIIFYCLLLNGIALYDKTNFSDHNFCKIKISLSTICFILTKCNTPYTITDFIIYAQSCPF